MKNIFFLYIILIFPLKALSQSDKIKIFLSCPCDDDFLKQNTLFFDYVGELVFEEPLTKNKTPLYSIMLEIEPFLTLKYLYLKSATQVVEKNIHLNFLEKISFPIQKIKSTPI